MRSGSIGARSAPAAAIAVALAAVAALALISSAGAAVERPPGDEPRAAEVTRLAPAAWCDDTLLERRVFVISANPASALTRRWNSLAEMQAASVNWYVRIGEGYDCSGSYTINNRTFWTTSLPDPIALVEAPACRYIQAQWNLERRGQRTRNGQVEYQWGQSVVDACGSRLGQNLSHWNRCSRISERTGVITGRSVRRTDWKMVYNVRVTITRECADGDLRQSWNIRTFDPDAAINGT